MKPAAADPAAAPVGGFCWQQVGVERLGGDPSLNVDRTRDGIEPDIAFTGPNDSVPWVVWYEQNASGDGAEQQRDGVRRQGDRAERDDTPTGTVDGGFNWTAVGNERPRACWMTRADGGFCGAERRQ